MRVVNRPVSMRETSTSFFAFVVDLEDKLKIEADYQVRLKFSQRANRNLDITGKLAIAAFCASLSHVGGNREHRPADLIPKDVSVSDACKQLAVGGRSELTPFPLGSQQSRSAVSVVIAIHTKHFFF